MKIFLLKAQRILYEIPLLVITLGAPRLALAHEKWFIHNITVPQTKPLLFTTWSSINASMVLLAVFAFTAALIIHFALRPHAWTRRMRSALGRFKAWTPYLLRILTGLLLFIASFMRFIFAPDLVTAYLPAATERSLLAIQLVIGLGLVIGIAPRFMAGLGFALYLLSLFIFPFSSALSYVFFAGIFIYIFIMGDPTLPKVAGEPFFPHLKKFIHFDHAKPYAFALMRVIAGFSFIYVGMLYKIAEPQYALEFVRMSGVNFLPALGFTAFTNEMFVFAAGLIEITIGFLILTGLLNRLIGALCLMLFTFTLAMFGIYELLGHLPLFGVAFALLTNGGGHLWSAELQKVSRKTAIAAGK